MNAYTRTLRDAILRSDFYAFAQKSFEVLHPGSTLQTNWHLELVAVNLVDIMTGKELRLILNAPPRSLKSLLGSVAFPAFVLGHDPTRQIICVSYTQDLANDLSSMRRRLMESDDYCRLFPRVCLVKSTENELQTDAGGFCYATSIGGTLTGRGGDILIIDDPLNSNEAYSEAARNRTNEWYSQTLLSRLNDKQRGAIVVIMQRLHQYDFTGYLLEQGGRWKHVKLPAFALEDTLISLPSRQFIWKQGEPLQPQREPISVLEKLKKEMGLPRFYAQYLEEPVPESGNMLKSDWLKYCEVNPSRQPGDQIVQSWDTAVKAAETSKFSVCLIFLVRNKNAYYLIDVLRQKLEFPELNKLVIAHAQKYNADVIIIEDQMSGSSLIQSAKRNGLQGVVAIRPDADKRTRMYSQTPKLEAGSLILPKSAPWVSDFREEYLAFPEGRYNDQIDALSQFLLWRTNSEYSRFHFDFGYDDESPGAPSADSIAYFFRRRR
jgi:predicted phage terminase large subunit-like protein